MDQPQSMYNQLVAGEIQCYPTMSSTKQVSAVTEGAVPSSSLSSDRMNDRAMHNQQQSPVSAGVDVSAPDPHTLQILRRLLSTPQVMNALASTCGDSSQQKPPNPLNQHPPSVDRPVALSAARSVTPKLQPPSPASSAAPLACNVTSVAVRSVASSGERTAASKSQQLQLLQKKKLKRSPQGNFVVTNQSNAFAASSGTGQPPSVSRSAILKGAPSSVKPPPMAYSLRKTRAPSKRRTQTANPRNKRPTKKTQTTPGKENTVGRVVPPTPEIPSSRKPGSNEVQQTTPVPLMSTEEAVKPQSQIASLFSPDLLQRSKRTEPSCNEPKSGKYRVSLTGLQDSEASAATVTVRGISEMRGIPDIDSEDVMDIDIGNEQRPVGALNSGSNSRSPVENRIIDLEEMLRGLQLDIKKQSQEAKDAGKRMEKKLDKVLRFLSRLTGLNLDDQGDQSDYQDVPTCGNLPSAGRQLDGSEGISDELHASLALQILNKQNRKGGKKKRRDVAAGLAMRCSVADCGNLCPGKTVVNAMVEDRLEGAKLRNGSLLGEFTGSLIRNPTPSGRLFVDESEAFDIVRTISLKVLDVFSLSNVTVSTEEKRHIELFLTENRKKIVEVVHESFRRGRLTKRTIMQKIFPAKEPDCPAFTNVGAFNMGLYRRLSEDIRSPFDRPGFLESVKAAFKQNSEALDSSKFCVNLSQISFVAVLIAREGFGRLFPIQRQGDARATLFILVPDLFSPKSSDVVQKVALAVMRAAIARDLDQSCAEKLGVGWELPDMRIILDREEHLETDKKLLGDRRA